MFPLNLGVDVTQISNEFFLSGIFAEHRRHFFLQVTYDVGMDLNEKATGLQQQSNYTYVFEQISTWIKVNE
jgi:hypothetical protein